MLNQTKPKIYQPTDRTPKVLENTGKIMKSISGGKIFDQKKIFEKINAVV